MKMKTLLLFCLLALGLTLALAQTTDQTPSSGSTDDPHHRGKDFDKDDEGGWFSKCDDHDDDDDHKDGEHMEKKHHGKHCGHKKAARLAIMITVPIVGVAIIVGISIGVYRYFKNRRKLSDSTLNLKANAAPIDKKALAYIVTEVDAKSLNSLPYPVVSTDPLPGKK